MYDEFPHDHWAECDGLDWADGLDDEYGGARCGCRYEPMPDDPYGPFVLVETCAECLEAMQQMEEAYAAEEAAAAVAAAAPAEPAPAPPHPFQNCIDIVRGHLLDCEAAESVNAKVVVIEALLRALREMPAFLAHHKRFRDAVYNKIQEFREEPALEHLVNLFDDVEQMVYAADAEPAPQMH